MLYREFLVQTQGGTNQSNGVSIYRTQWMICGTTGISDYNGSQGFVVITGDGGQAHPVHV